MKNTCVCIEGQLRGSERCGPTIKKHLVDKLNADLYFVLQNYHEHEDKNVNFYGNPKKVVVYDNPEPTPLPIPNSPITSKPGTFEEIFDSLCDDFNYDKLLWRKTFQEVKNLNYTFGYDCPGTCIRRMYNRYLIYKELSGLKYDWFILLRSDLYFVDDFVSDKIKTTLNLYQKGGHNGLNNNLIAFNRKIFERVLTYIKNFLSGLFLDYYLKHHANLFLNEELFFGINMNLENVDPNFIETRWYISANSQRDYTTWAGVNKSTNGDLYKYDYDYSDCMNFLKTKHKVSSIEIFKIQELDSEEVPSLCLKLIKDKEVLFEEEEYLKKYTKALTENINLWTKNNSKIYQNKNIVCKEDLQDKEKWYVKIPNSRHAYTSGTSTGVPFEYMRWDSIFHTIEWENHYDMVLDEFDVSDRPNILFFLPHSYDTDGDKFIACSGGRSPSNFVNHGSKRDPIIHHVNFELYKQRQEDFYAHLLDYAKENQIDVFYTSPPQVNSLCSYIRKFGRTDRVAYLLSTTGERLLPEDAAFLLDGGYFDHVCDHMRCWDGGATFFTCKHRNYHLMDNLAWCEEGPNHELICTDYFNLASPFVRYWNGDYCRIAKEYQRCECGRLYRDFEFLESRPFSLKGTNMREIREKIKALNIKGIKQVRCSVHNLNVVSTRDLTDLEKNMIRSVSDKFQFEFACEPF